MVSNGSVSSASVLELLGDRLEVFGQVVNGKELDSLLGVLEIDLSRALRNRNDTFDLGRRASK
jgi:hypothetical protein